MASLGRLQARLQEASSDIITGAKIGKIGGYREYCEKESLYAAMAGVCKSYVIPPEELEQYLTWKYGNKLKK